jgi:hypothetical protein
LHQKNEFQGDSGYHGSVLSFARNIMNRSCLRLLLAFALVLSVPLSAIGEPACSIAVPVHGHCEIAISELHPTQPSIGLMQVEERVIRMKHGIDGVTYTSKRPVPVVQGPDGSFYVTDGHHLVSTLMRVGTSKVMADIIGRFDNPRTFWGEMQNRHWVYLHDAKGNSIAPSALPKHFSDLQDDPYRALAGYAESAGYFHRSDVYFAEFYWARYFGEKMDWQPVDRLNLLAALHSAEKLACLPEASKLPGYAGPCPAKH